MARLDMRKHFFHIQIVIAAAEPSQSFSHLKSATAAAADMVSTKQRTLCARIRFQHFRHRRFRGNTLCFCRHECSYFNLILITKEFLDVTDDLDEPINLRRRVVKVKTGPSRGVNPQLAHERLVAM